MTSVVTMTRIFFAVLFVLATVTNVAMADGSPREDLFDQCAVLTWPDGHESRLRGIRTNFEFAEACESKGNCKIDGKEFASLDKLQQALANATMECLLLPLRSTSKNDGPDQRSSYIEQLRNLAPSLSSACQLIFLNPAAPIFPSIEAECKVGGRADENWCMATKLANFYLRWEQRHEFAVMYDNLTLGCPAPQLREYFKARLYYLATQLDSKDIARSAYRDFDFGPVDATILGAIRSNGNVNTLGKEYDLAMDKHHPQKHFALKQMQARCQSAQPINPPDAAR